MNISLEFFYLVRNTRRAQKESAATPSAFNLKRTQRWETALDKMIHVIEQAMDAFRKHQEELNAMDANNYTDTPA